MSLVLADRVMETTTTTGTGTLTLAGAVTGFQSFGAVGDGNTCFYCIFSVDTNGNANGAWEVGQGTYTLSGTTLSRDTVFASSNSGSAVSFAAGTKRVILTVPAEKTIVNQASSTFSMSSVAWANWIKADAITPQTDNTALSTWPDSSGNGNSFTQTGSNRPKYRTGANGINGVPGVQFTSSSSESMATTAGAASLTGNFYVGIVMQWLNAGAFEDAISWGDASSGKRRSIISNGNGVFCYLGFVGQSADHFQQILPAPLSGQ